MAIVYYGLASTPTDGNSNDASPTAITPPADMSSGQLVVVVCHNRLKSDTHAVSATGGQTWNKLTTQANANYFDTTTWFWCVYNGTWSANPSFSHGGTNNTCMMMVFTPTSSYTWSVDVSEAPAHFAAPSSPYDITITGITTAANSVMVASWASNDDNSWAYQSGNATAPTGSSVNNMAGSDSGLLMVYRLMSGGGATGNQVARQGAQAGDAGTQNIMSFKETAPAVTLTMSDGAHTHAADNAVLIRIHLLVMADAAHAQTADNAVLTQLHNLTMSDGQHSHAADNAVLTELKTLAVADAAHAQAADNAVLTELKTLAVADAAHAHAADNTVLTEYKTLAIADAAHGQTADNIDLVPVAGGDTVLTMSDGVHTHAADNAVLTQLHNLALSDAAHVQTSDNAVLTQLHNLVLGDAAHSQAADNVTLEAGADVTDLILSDAVHGHSADVPSLIEHKTLVVSDCSHSMKSDMIRFLGLFYLMSFYSKSAAKTNYKSSDVIKSTLSFKSKLR